MALWSRIRNLLRPDRHDRELDEELAFHLEMRARDNVDSGMSPDEARRDACLRFGNMTAEKEKTRDAGVSPSLDAVAQDVRYGMRALRKSGGVSLLVIIVLALGIGANTAIFTIMHALVLRSLPVKDPAHLFNVQIGNFMSWGYIEESNTFTWALWNNFIRRQDVLDDVFAYSETRFDAVLNSDTKQVTSAFIGGPMFRTLGLQPVAGRTFEESVGNTGPPAEAVISYALWTREMAANPSAVGRPLIIEGKPFTVVGILPPRFFGLVAGHATDIYLPLSAEPYIRGTDSAFPNPVRYWLHVFGRLRPGLTVDQAQSRVSAMSMLSMRATLPEELPERVRPQYVNQRFLVLPAAAGVSYIRTNLEIPLAILSAITALLLLLTCFTVANLLIARATARQKEIAIRIALGAGRARIMRQLVLESILLAVAGAILGLAIARIAAALLIGSYSSQADPLMLDLSPDWTVSAFSIALVALSALIFGVAPAFRASQVNASDAFKGGTATASAGVLGIRCALLTAQIAVSVVLVTGAVFFGATLRNLLTVDTGFQSDRVLLVDLDLRRAEVAKSARRQFYVQLLERMKRLATVESASMSFVTPISGSTWQFDVAAETSSGPKRVHIFYNGVSPDFFETYGTPVLAGRSLSDRDTTSSPPVALVNATLARSVFGSTGAIGRRITMTDPERRTVEIIGIVQDAKYRNLRQAVPPTLYSSWLQQSTPPPHISVALRSRSGAAPLVREVGRVLTSEYPNVSFRMTSFSAQITDSIARERAFATLCGFFGLLALMLAAIGIYGVLSYFIAQRLSEIGIRMALGATPAAVRSFVYRQSFTTCAAGVTLGCLLAFWAGRFIKTLLYGVAPEDLTVYGTAVTAIGAVAAIATILPALRASRTDPMNVLRL